MTLFSNNALTLGVGIQTAKGTPQATPGVTLRYTGGYGPEPTKSTVTLAETDANRVQSDPVVTGYQVAGDSEGYVRPSEEHIIAQLLLGHTVTTGAGPYVHTSDSTASGSAPYATLFKNTSGVQIVEMADVQISSVQWGGAAGAALNRTVSWVGGGAVTFGVTDPGVAPASDVPITYPSVTVTRAGVHDGSVQSFNLTANQNRTSFTGDSGLYPFDVAAGLYAVTGSVVAAYQADANYRLFHTGSTTGTTPTTTLGAQTLAIVAALDATHSVTWNLANVFITNYTINYGTDGAPLTESYDFSSKHDTTLANVLQMVVRNAVALP